MRAAPSRPHARVRTVLATAGIAVGAVLSSATAAQAWTAPVPPVLTVADHLAAGHPAAAVGQRPAGHEASRSAHRHAAGRHRVGHARHHQANTHHHRHGHAGHHGHAAHHHGHAAHHHSHAAHHHGHAAHHHGHAGHHQAGHHHAAHHHGRAAHHHGRAAHHNGHAAHHHGRAAHRHAARHHVRRHHVAAHRRHGHVHLHLTRAQKVERVIKLARAQRGKPYVWGAAGPHAFDCSGFVQWVYRHAIGRHLPKYTDTQYAYTDHVHSVKHLRRGDLVFVRSHGHEEHVGIYAGHWRWWVAPHTGSHVKLQHIYPAHHVYSRVIH